MPGGYHMRERDCAYFLTLWRSLGSRRPTPHPRFPQLYARAKEEEPLDNDTDTLSEGVTLNLTLVGMFGLPATRSS
jgi:hypothetical protein